MEILPVALFRSRSAAESIKNRLVEAGFDARLGDDPGRKKLWFARRSEAGVSVDVPGDQLERAGKLLPHWETTENALSEAIRCPECKSFRVQYPQFARHSVLTNILLGLASAIGAVEKQYYCEECYYTWPKERKPGGEP